MGTERQPRRPSRPRQSAHDIRTAEATALHLERIKARNKRIAILAVSICLCIVLLAGVFTGLYFLLRAPKDDGKILPNVSVGGVNIGGMTPEEATNALQVSVYRTVSQQSMVVELPGASLVLKPADTKVQLDLEALVEDAYAYGRSGSNLEQNLLRAQAEKRVHTIALLPYLNLDLDYIRSTVEEFCAGYSILITQPSVSLSGDRPVYIPPVEEEELPDEENPDEENPEGPDEESPVTPDGEEDLTPPATEPEPPEEPEEEEDPIIHQVLSLTVGTPQFLLESSDLYASILDAYSLLQMHPEYEAPNRIEPEKLDLIKIFEEFCVAPEDAALDPKTFLVTPEVVGYGFDIAAVQSLLDEAEYGQTIDVTLGFLMPDITEKAFSYLFQDVLAEYTSQLVDVANANRDKNVQLSCEAINGYVIKSGESFDFNLILGPRTTDKGYKNAPNYSGSTTYSVGGGITQTASVLHYCALQAGLQITERHAHRYAVPYTTIGMDASIDYGKENLVFVNTTSDPIRIEATASGSTVHIRFLGTNVHSYRMELEAEVISTVKPGTTYQIMAPDNIMGYQNGQVLTPAHTGYTIRVYRYRVDIETGERLQRQLMYTATYDKRDQIVVRIEATPVLPPINPTEPQPTDPSVTP